MVKPSVGNAGSQSPKRTRKRKTTKKKPKPTRQLRNALSDEQETTPNSRLRKSLSGFEARSVWGGNRHMEQKTNSKKKQIGSRAMSSAASKSSTQNWPPRKNKCFVQKMKRMSPNLLGWQQPPSRFFFAFCVVFFVGLLFLLCGFSPPSNFGSQFTQVLEFWKSIPPSAFPQRRSPVVTFFTASSRSAAAYTCTRHSAALRAKSTVVVLPHASFTNVAGGGGVSEGALRLDEKK